MIKHIKSLRNVVFLCLRYERNCVSGRKSGDKCSLNHKSETSTFIRCQECELCGFVHDHFITFDSDFVQLMCIESRLKEELNFEQCADFGADDGDGKNSHDLAIEW